MQTNPVLKHISIVDFSITPMYVQLAQSIIRGMKTGVIKPGDKLPSINEVSFELDVSRVTVERGYGYLKTMGVIESCPGKGYFIGRQDVSTSHRIFLLFNKLSHHKKIMYDAFAGTLGQMADIDFFIYNNDFSLFKKLVLNRRTDYTDFVIIPHFFEQSEHVQNIINSIPVRQLILLDKVIDGVNQGYGAVYENFEKDIYAALSALLPQLVKYQKIKIVFPEYTYHPVEILQGFKLFCTEYAFEYAVVRDVNTFEIAEGEVYINLMEDDLIKLLQKASEAQLQVGQQIGIISYNETPWKEFILNGITTISTNFYLMGTNAANMILHNKKELVEIPFTVTLRSSL